jgi:hypothetical protein
MGINLNQSDRRDHRPGGDIEQLLVLSGGVVFQELIAPPKFDW